MRRRPIGALKGCLETHRSAVVLDQTRALLPKMNSSRSMPEATETGAPALPFHHFPTSNAPLTALYPSRGAVNFRVVFTGCEENVSPGARNVDRIICFTRLRCGCCSLAQGAGLSIVVQPRVVTKGPLCNVFHHKTEPSLAPFPN
jgi:hypothetical protein